MKKLRDLLAAASANDGTRSLRQSIMVPELISVLEDWVQHVGTGVLIGGLAFSFHGKPRQTMDIDFVFLTDTLPSVVPRFKRVRPHCFRHDSTHVEVETLEPQTIHMSPALATWILGTSHVDHSLGRPVRVASVAGVIASKLGRWSLRDQADADELLDHFSPDLSGAPLDNKERSRLDALLLDRAARKRT